MDRDPRRVLVTGAEEHQGLAVVRGLGVAGIQVVACGAQPRSLAFHSRYASACRTYTPPSQNPRQFADDVVAIAEEMRPDLIMPAVETTLVALNASRERIEAVAPLAAPAAAILEMALDKARTVDLARRLGVPVSVTVTGRSLEDLLAGASRLRFPVVVKPRGNALHPTTVHAIPFKSRYADSPADLERIVAPHSGDVHALLVQERARGTGRCIAAVCRHGEPIAMFAYARDREFPLSGGVSVMRRSIPLAQAARDYTSRLLRAIHWHGVAMVEFKYDDDADVYTLMEINGRFQASTALALDAGLNLPLLAACMFTGWTPPAVTPYRVGVEERWLRGDVLALRGALTDARRTGGPATAPAPRRRDVIARFIADFRRGVHFDEFRRDDVRPGIAECRTLLRIVGDWAIDAVRSMGARAAVRAATLARRVSRGLSPRALPRL